MQAEVVEAVASLHPLTEVLAVAVAEKLTRVRPRAQVPQIRVVVVVAALPPVLLAAQES